MLGDSLKKKFSTLMAWKFTCYFVTLLDDILIARNNVKDVMKVKVGLDKEFDMKDLGDASRILGIDI